MNCISASAATWATMLDLPIPGGPQIIVLIGSFALTKWLR
jgi:hypothetical protein